MPALTVPCTIFKTQKRMDDYSASDMRYGDLSETQLKRDFHLVDISSKVNPWTLTKLSPFSQPQSMFQGSRGVGQKVSLQQCANILFDEFRSLSGSFAIYGQYKHLIEQMIIHMQRGKGTVFTSSCLDNALREHILSGNSRNSTRLRISKALSDNIDWVNNIYPEIEKLKLTENIREGRLPKLDRFKDNFNGMGITVHDTWATHIKIKSLKINNVQFHASIHYKVQDHFGLDNQDIKNFKFRQLRFFRIWFILQRFNKFGFQPFMTNMEATVEITGGRNET